MINFEQGSPAIELVLSLKSLIKIKKKKFKMILKYLTSFYFKLVMFPDITHYKVNNGHKSAIFNFFELKYSGHIPLKTAHFVIYSNIGLAI